MDVSGYSLSDSIVINRPPEEVYEIVCDVTRMGELSPVCKSCAWDDATAAGQPGARFTGHNVIGEFSWDTHCSVAAAEPGREFTFINHGPKGDADLVRWSYTFAPDGAGTRVTESWQVLPRYPEFVSGGDPNFDVKGRVDGMATMARDGMKATLTNLKMVAES
jgi:carbon monoxide dehydrogenase subunit G